MYLVQKKPENIVNGEIRRRCYDLDFPTAHPIKLFGISGYKGKKPLFVLAKDYKQEKRKIVHSQRLKRIFYLKKK